jgi:ribonuclease D
MRARLMDTPAAAVDIESNSLYVYYEKVCLIQFSIPGTDYLVDPFAVDLSSLGPFFAEARHEKVFHAAQYDILSLKRDYGFDFANLFDTMLAARLLGWKRYGLGAILEEHFGVPLNKRMQRYNWGTRPLPQQALHYARLDTHFLLPLRDKQVAELQAKKRLEEARRAFERETHIEPAPKVFNPDDFWRVRGARELAPAEQAVLRELFILRDQYARKLNRPPFKVMNDATLVRLAQVKPADQRSLGRVKGLSHYITKQTGADLLGAVARGLRAPAPAYPRNQHKRPDEATMLRYEALRNWRKGKAEARNVEPDVILSNSALMDLARQAPHTRQALAQVNGLDEWQRRTYGDELLKVLNRQAARH